LCGAVIVSRIPREVEVLKLKDADLLRIEYKKTQYLLLTSLFAFIYTMQ
jgi:hypothetical protein